MYVCVRECVHQQEDKLGASFSVCLSTLGEHFSHLETFFLRVLIRTSGFLALQAMLTCSQAGSKPALIFSSGRDALAPAWGGSLLSVVVNLGLTV